MSGCLSHHLGRVVTGTGQIRNESRDILGCFRRAIRRLVGSIITGRTFRIRRFTKRCLISLQYPTACGGDGFIQRFL